MAQNQEDHHLEILSGLDSAKPVLIGSILDQVQHFMKNVV